LNVKGEILMKRSRVMAIVLAAAIMLIGIGYAAWTDELQINNTVQTGIFEMIFEDVQGLNKGWEDYDNHEYDDPNYNPPINDPSNPGKPFQTGDFNFVNIDNPGRHPIVILSDNKQMITFQNDNFYPGSGAWLKFKIRNNGTIPAKVKEIKGVIDPASDAIQDDFQYTISSVVLYRENGQVAQTLYGQSSTFDTFDAFIAELSRRLSQYPDGSPIILEPGEYIYVNGTDETSISGGYDIFMKNSAGDETENCTLKFDLLLDYIQWNAR